MKITATSAVRNGNGREVEFNTTKTALVGVRNNHYAATKSQFRKVFRAAPDIIVYVRYGNKKRRRGTLGQWRQFSFYNDRKLSFGCMTFEGNDLIQLRRWALRKG